MTEKPHRIRRQRWQVLADSPASALALRQTLRSALDDVLAPALERAFDALGLGDRVLHLPRVAVTIRLAEGDDFLATLAERVEREVGEALQRLASEDTADAPARSVAPQASWRGVLLAYLRDGTITWHAATMETAELLANLRDAARAFIAGDVVSQLGDSAEQRVAASFRLLQLLATSERAELLKHLANQDAAVEPLRALRLRVAGSAPALEPRHLLATAIVVALRPSDLRSPWPPAVARWMAECAELFDALKIGEIEGLRPGSASHFEEAPDSRREAVDDADERTFHESAILEESGSTADETVPSSAPHPALEDAHARAGDAPTGTMVPHAGLVLLHPFLSRLFVAAGVLPVGAKAIPSAQRPRSAALLHWLATGRCEVYEFELPLVKVLLGLSPEAPLAATEGLLGDADRAEADALLTAAVEHWSALGKTSIDALRGSFLRRRGLLNAGERGWKLRVETESYDVLLGRLPWAVGIVKLPWMSKPMFIDWPTP